MLARTEHWSMPLRVAARTLAILALCPGGTDIVAGLSSRSAQPTRAAIEKTNPDCGLAAKLEPLDRLPRSVILVPLAMGPTLLLGTHQATVTGPYHRDPAALEDVLRFFTGGEADRIARQRHADYVAFCPDDGEMAAIARFAPTGLAASLLHDRAPDWLQPVTLPGTAGLKLYRVQ
jgi:hypothetical protein